MGDLTAEGGGAWMVDNGVMAEVKLSSGNQIVIPVEARKALNVKAGDKILVTVMGNEVIILKKPESWSGAIRGLARGTYPPDYLERERSDWD
jgi:AbrB family looped-hinge helix DNA binding protein